MATTLIAFKNRTISSLLATLILGLLVPFSPTNADAPVLTIVTDSVIDGVTPPVPGATPVTRISETNNEQYTGTVTWESYEGPLIGSFETNTVYAAVITLTLADGYTIEGLPQYFSFEVQSSTRVTFNPESMVIKAYFAPTVGDVEQYLDTSFGENGSINVRDIFGEYPLNDTGTAVGPVKVDRVAVDSEGRIVVLGSFYGTVDQDSGVSGAGGIDIGTGHKNSVSIADQTGDDFRSSAAVTALDYVSFVNGSEYADWYLPSQHELRELYSQRYAVGIQDGFLPKYYWSSSQLSTNEAHYKSFSDGAELGALKFNSFHVRPIRAGDAASTLELGDPGPGGGTIFYVSEQRFPCGPTLEDLCDFLEAAPSDWFGYMEDPKIPWSKLVDSHILFRLTPDGIYDETFGNQEQTLRRGISDSPKPYVLVTTTCSSYAERVDLEIDSQDRILVQLSGSAIEGECSGGHHNFIVRYTESGYIDEDFGNLGVIGNLNPQFTYPDSLYDQFTLDDFDNVLAVSLSNETQTAFIVEKFSPGGLIDADFGEDGVLTIDVGYPVIEEPQDIYPVLYRYLRVVSDDADGYIIAFSVVIEPYPNSDYLPFTKLLSIDSQGNFTSGFEDVVLPYFLLTDLAMDGPSGFIVSGTYFNFFQASSDFLGRILRINRNGEIDVTFSDLSEINLSGNSQEDPLLRTKFSDGCINSALLSNRIVNQSIFGVIAGELCWYGGGRLKAFAPSGAFQGGFDPVEFSNNADSAVINQLITTRNERLLILSGATPNTGALDLLSMIFESSDAPEYWTQATISRYLFSQLNTPITLPPAPIYAPTPVPYLRTLSLPTLNRKDSKLVCTAGTYNAGYTLDGVIQGSGTFLFTPTTYTYNLNINGVAQSSLTNISSSTTTSWDMPSATSGSLITCSVTVSANGVTNTDRSSDNSAGVSSAKAAQSASIAKAESDYSALLTANEKAYQKALIDNRSKWRNDAETLRKNYQAEIAAIRALPSTKETRGSSLAALKNYTAAVKKNSADYKASKPAALVERDAANKNALAAKNAEVESANAAYGIFIESIGYGVLVP